MHRIRKIIPVVLLFLVAVLSPECASADDSRLLIPIGRLLANGNDVVVSIDSKNYTPEMRSDDSGGAWFEIPAQEIRGRVKIGLTITKTNSSTRIQDIIDMKRWTSPDRLIDSDNPAIVSKSNEIAGGRTGGDEKARSILLFVVRQIQFKTYRGMHYDTASATLARGYGICVNHSRLFVALCRAAGIAARTISGAILGDNGNYYHHEWVEFFDDEKYWHPLDPTISTDFIFQDLKRIDLLYDIESNPLYPFDRGWEVDRVKLDERDSSIFCPNWDVQRLNGQMSYKLVSDLSPASLTASVEYKVSDYLK